MVSKLATYISDLLYEHDAVIVPNFGGFVTSYKASAIDHVQGLIYPPSKTISFNENLVVNDGVLINHVRKELNLSAQDARLTVESFVQNVKASIERREIVVFPDVGRLYMDYEQKLQFLPDNTNYNTDVYGLPTVQYYPIMRTREQVANEAPNPVAAAIPAATHYEAEKAKRINRWTSFSSVVPYIIAGAVLLGSFGLYSKIQSSGNHSPFVEAIKIPNVNIKPRPQINTAETEIKIDEDELDAMVEEDIAEEKIAVVEEKPVTKKTTKQKKKVERAIDTEGATLGGNRKLARIAVHAFGDPKNVRKMTDELINLKYNPYTEKSKSLTRVGVKVVYESDRQLQKVLKNIRKQVSKRAYIEK